MLGDIRMNLNDEDKQWIKGELAAVQGHLETRFDAMLERVETTLTARFDAKLEHVETTLTTRFDAKLEHVETTLLTEFHKWASPLEARQRTHAATLRALDLEMEALSDRVTKLEPPH
jgi:hypothetical protein